MPIINDFMNMIDEMAYPQFIPYVYSDAQGRYAYFIYQNDQYPGAFVQNSDAPSDIDPTDNYYRAVKVRLDRSTWDVEEIVNFGSEISIYPNPVSGKMSFVLNEDADVTIFNLMGQKVANFKGNAGVNNFDASSLNAGIYFLQAGSTTERFVVK